MAWTICSVWATKTLQREIGRRSRTCRSRPAPARGRVDRRRGPPSAAGPAAPPAAAARTAAASGGNGEREPTAATRWRGLEHVLIRSPPTAGWLTFTPVTATGAPARDGVFTIHERMGARVPPTNRSPPASVGIARRNATPRGRSSSRSRAADPASATPDPDLRPPTWLPQGLGGRLADVGRPRRACRSTARAGCRARSTAIIHGQWNTGPGGPARSGSSATRGSRRASSSTSSSRAIRRARSRPLRGAARASAARACSTETDRRPRRHWYDHNLALALAGTSPPSSTSAATSTSSRSTSPRPVSTRPIAKRDLRHIIRSCWPGAGAAPVRLPAVGRPMRVFWHDDALAHDTGTGMFDQPAVAADRGLRAAPGERRADPQHPLRACATGRSPRTCDGTTAGTRP